jgi:hypothetical protein
MTIARDWNRDGWTKLDWDAVGIYSRALTKAASDLDNRAGSSGSDFSPHELLDLADCADAIAKRLRELAKNYI